MARRKRHTVSSASEVGGALWKVATTFSEEYVVAADYQSAVATYLAFPEVIEAAKENPQDVQIRELRRCAPRLLSLPVDITGDGNWGGS